MDMVWLYVWMGIFCPRRYPFPRYCIACLSAQIGRVRRTCFYIYPTRPIAVQCVHMRVVCLPPKGCGGYRGAKEPVRDRAPPGRLQNVVLHVGVLVRPMGIGVSLSLSLWWCVSHSSARHLGASVRLPGCHPWIHPAGPVRHVLHVSVHSHHFGWCFSLEPKFPSDVLWCGVVWCCARGPDRQACPQHTQWPVAGSSCCLSASALSILPHLPLSRLPRLLLSRRLFSNNGVSPRSHCPF